MYRIMQAVRRTFSCVIFSFPIFLKCVINFFQDMNGAVVKAEYATLPQSTGHKNSMKKTYGNNTG
jgi:hypothetical protein